MRKFEISEQLAAAIQNYLATRPLKETYDMYNAIGQLTVIQVQEIPKDGPEKAPEDAKKEDEKKEPAPGKVTSIKAKKQSAAPTADSESKDAAKPV